MVKDALVFDNFVVMHRRGLEDDDLLVAISPPPEFQDLPAPPPTVFRDTSPSPCTKSQAHHQRLCDFAARISFNIVNEAMVIATEEVVSNVSYPTTRTVSSHVHHTSGSPGFEQNQIFHSYLSPKTNSSVAPFFRFLHHGFGSLGIN